MKKERLPFYTDGNRVLYVEMSVKVDEAGEWLSPEQVQRLEALHNWARFCIHSSAKIRKTKKLFRTDQAPQIFNELKSSTVTGFSVISVPVGVGV